MMRAAVVEEAAAAEAAAAKRQRGAVHVGVKREQDRFGRGRGRGGWPCEGAGTVGGQGHTSGSPQ